jgi:hypothetical protein
MSVIRPVRPMLSGRESRGKEFGGGLRVCGFALATALDFSSLALQAPRGERA